MNLRQYESAWRLLAENTQTISDVTKTALVSVALNLNYRENSHLDGVKELFGSRWSNQDILKCLDEILRTLGIGQPSFDTHLAVRPTFPVSAEESQARTGAAAGRILAGYDFDARIRELQHSPEPVDIAETAKAQFTKTQATKDELAKLNSHIEKLKADQAEQAAQAAPAKAKAAKKRRAKC